MKAFDHSGVQKVNKLQEIAAPAGEDSVEADSIQGFKISGGGGSGRFAVANLTELSGGYHYREGIACMCVETW